MFKANAIQIVVLEVFIGAKVKKYLDKEYFIQTNTKTYKLSDNILEKVYEITLR